MYKCFPGYENPDSQGTWAPYLDLHNVKKWRFFPPLNFGKPMYGKAGLRPASRLKILCFCILKRKFASQWEREDGLRPKPIYKSTPADRCSLDKRNFCSSVKELSNRHGSKGEPSCQLHLSAASNQTVNDSMTLPKISDPILASMDSWSFVYPKGESEQIHSSGF